MWVFYEERQENKDWVKGGMHDWMQAAFFGVLKGAA